MEKKSSYEVIQNKINALKDFYPSLRQISNPQVFTILCVKSNYYKNPSYVLTETEMVNILVDSVKDGGVDALLADPNSETNDLIICQSKFQNTITFDEVRDAVAKMILFYK